MALRTEQLQDVVRREQRYYSSYWLARTKHMVLRKWEHLRRFCLKSMADDNKKKAAKSSNNRESPLKSNILWEHFQKTICNLIQIICNVLKKACDEAHWYKTLSAITGKGILVRYLHYSDLSPISSLFMYAYYCHSLSTATDDYVYSHVIPIPHHVCLMHPVGVLNPFCLPPEFASG